MHKMGGTRSIKEIAKALGLSRNTVSKVLNNKPGVSDRTVRLVMECVGRADRQDESIQHAEPRGGTILFSYRQENIEYINGLLSGIEKTVKEHGYLLALNIVDSASEPTAPFLESAYSSGLRGILSFNIYDVTYWRQVIDSGIPSVFFDTQAKRHLFAGKTDIVCSENERPISEVMRILKEAGRERFGFYGDPTYCASLRERHEIFRAMCDELGLEVDPSHLFTDDFSRERDGEIVGILKRRIQKLQTLPDALICASDRQAVLMHRVLKELDIAIPDAVAVVGFDNLPESARLLPPLTTIEAYSPFMGEIAVKRLLERIAAPHKPYEFIRCQTTLILRESTGHARD